MTHEGAPPGTEYALAYSELEPMDASPGAPAVVGLHGMASSGRTMRHALRSLAARGMPVLLPDLLGFGASPRPTGVAYDTETHLAALHACVNERLGPDRTLWLVGSSMGALLALAWAAREPQRIRGVVAISAPLFTSADDARRWLGTHDPIAALMIRAPSVMRIACHLLCGEHGPGLRASHLRALRGAFGQGALWMYGLGGPRPVVDADALPVAQCGLLEAFEDVWLHSWDSLNDSMLRCIVERQAWPDLERLRDLGTPLLFLQGDHDALAPVVRVRQAAGYGGWPLREYPGATHALTISHGQSLGREITAFIAQAEQQCEQQQATFHASAPMPLHVV